MKTLIISDAWGFGLIETKPFPLLQQRFFALRNKALLVPEYGVMYVAAFLAAHGKPFTVANLIVDCLNEESLYREPREGGDGLADTESPVASAEVAERLQRHFEATLREASPDVILFPVSIYHIALHARELMARAKRLLPGVTIIAGGVYSSMHADEILADGHADYVVRGEGEWTALELLEALETGGDVGGIAGASYRRDGLIVHNPPREREKEIDRFPHIYTVSEHFRIEERYRLLKSLNPFDDYIPGGGFLTSRGCPEQCTFCLDPAVWGRVTRYHSPAYVREVVDYCSEHFGDGSDSFYFGDATFALNRRRLFEVLEKLRGIPYSYNIQTRADTLTEPVLKALQEAGFSSVAIGAESLNDRILTDVVKKRVSAERIIEAVRAVRDHGMTPVLTFIAGLPGESRSSIERTVDILRREKITMATFFPLVVFRGTGLYETFLATYSEAEREALRLNDWSEEYCFVNEEFPTMAALLEFTEEINNRIRA